jgi:hypothetical protein
MRIRILDLLDPGFGIWDLGWKNEDSGIRDKCLGSATLVDILKLNVFFEVNTSWFGTV